jgi:MATE family multidrug resistance protein
VFGALVWVSADLLPLMNQPEADVRLARSYSRILAVSALPMLLFLVFKQFADGLSATRAAMYVTLAGLAFNTFANWLLIFGNWGFPRLELDGAGYATLASRALMLLLMGGYVLRARRFSRYRFLQTRLRADAQRIRSILRLGIPSGLQYFFEMGAFIGAGILIGWMENGSANRAAHQVAMSMASVTYMIVTGFAAGATIRVGHALGQRNPVQMRHAGLAGMWLAAAFMLLAALVLIFGRQLFTRLYVGEPEVQRIAASLLVFAALFQLFDGLQAVGASVLRGIQDVRIPTVITFVAYWMIALPAGWVLGFTFGLGVYGLWYGFVISLIFAAVALVWRFSRITRRWMQEGLPAAAHAAQ